MARKKCPKCNSTKIIKKGSNIENSSINALVANTGLLKKRISWVKKSYEDYSIHKFTYSELERKYGLNRKTIRKYFDELSLAELKNDFKVKELINLVFDACHFKREFCLFLFRSRKQNIHFEFKDSEKIIYYEKTLKAINQHYEFSSFTIDGKRGVIQLLENLFPKVPIQLCQFHQVKTILKYTTRRPKT